MFQCNYKTGWPDRYSPRAIAELTVPQINQISNLNFISTVLPTDLMSCRWLLRACLIFTDPKGPSQGTQQSRGCWTESAVQLPPHKLRYSPRKICSENAIVEDVYSADVAYRKVAHCYKKGVSGTKNTEDQIVAHPFNQLSLLSLPHPPRAISHKVLCGPLPSQPIPSPHFHTRCSEPFVFSHLDHCSSSQLRQRNGITWGAPGPTPRYPDFIGTGCT